MVKPRNEWNQTTKTKQNEWRKKYRALLGADMPKQEADQFRTLCKSSGVSVSAALSKYVRAAIHAGTLDIIRDDIPVTAAPVLLIFRRETRPTETTRQAPLATQKIPANDTPGTVDLSTANDTPGSVCRPPVSDTPGTVD